MTTNDFSWLDAVLLAVSVSLAFVMLRRRRRNGIPGTGVCAAELPGDRVARHCPDLDQQYL